MIASKPAVKLLRALSLSLSFLSFILDESLLLLLLCLRSHCSNDFPKDTIASSADERFGSSAQKSCFFARTDR